MVLSRALYFRPPTLAVLVLSLRLKDMLQTRGLTFLSGSGDERVSLEVVV